MIIIRLIYPKKTYSETFKSYLRNLTKQIHNAMSVTGQKTVLLALQMLGIKIQEALHTHLFVTQIWSRCMNTIWNQPIIPDSRRKYEYFSSVLIIYWVWMPFLQRCSLSWFRQYFLWNANECVSTNSFKYTLKWIITI